MKTKNTNAILLIFFGVMAVSCNTKDSHIASIPTDTTAVNEQIITPARKNIPLKGCYILILKKDTLQLAITAVNGQHVEGSLIYAFAEKDNSKGTFEGEYINGILRGNYIFNAEGTSSERQIIFKKVKDGFVEGFGTTTIVGNKEVFSKPDDIVFDQSRVFEYTANCLV
jgi:hypothetical protein